MVESKENLDAFFNVRSCLGFSENREEVNYLLSELNPYFKNAKHKLIVIEDKARVVCFFDPNSHHNDEPVVYFGYWDTVDNTNINKQIFLECEKWAKLVGATHIIGPMNFNTFHDYRLCLTPKPRKNFFKEPVNPSYYPRLLKDIGFEVLNTYVSYFIDGKEKIKSWYNTYYEKSKLLNTGLTYKFITPDLWMSNLKELHQRASLVFGDNFAYSEIDFQTFSLKYGEVFSKMICPKTSLLVFNKQEEIVGIFLCFPDYEDLAALEIPFKEYSYDKYMSCIKSRRLLIKTVGILNEYSHLGGSIIEMLLNILPAALQNYSDFVYCLMQKGNFPSLVGASFKDYEHEYGLFVKKVKNDQREL